MAGDDHGKKDSGGGSKNMWPLAAVACVGIFLGLQTCSDVVGGRHLSHLTQQNQGQVQQGVPPFQGLTNVRPAAPNPPVQSAISGRWRCETPTPKNEGGQRFYVAFGRRMDMTTPRPTSTSRLCIDGIGAKWEENINR